MPHAPLVAVSHFLNTALADLRARPVEQESLRGQLAEIDQLLVQAINLVAPLIRHDGEYIPYHGPRELAFEQAAAPRSETGTPRLPLTSQGGGGRRGRGGAVGEITLKFKQDLDDLLK